MDTSMEHPQNNGPDKPPLSEKHASLVVYQAITDLLVTEGLIDEKQLRYAERVRSKIPGHKTMISVLEDLKYITAQELRDTLRSHSIAVPLGSLLVELGHLSEEDLAKALAQQKEEPDKRLGEILIDHHFIEEHDLLTIVSYQLGLKFLEPQINELDSDLIRSTPVPICRKHLFVPAGRQDSRIVIAFHDPTSQKAMEQAQKFFGFNIEVGIAPIKTITDALDRLAERAEKRKQKLAEKTAIDHTDNYIVKTVQALFVEAWKEKASDIHIQPGKETLSIRLRKDGVLMPYKTFPIEMAPAVASRIKLLAGANIADRRRHQDGRIVFEHDGQDVDMRVSSYATIHGEKIVLRLLGAQSELKPLNELGMASLAMQRLMEEGIGVPGGVLIVTGPTGSGKTTTLYSMVQYLKNDTTAIISAEDPVEYVIDGVAQCSIDPAIGVTYEESLKHMVRQDPDVIIIGEIRDGFSAEIAINSALTGHKVLTTFHTEDAAGALIRLLNMEIEPFLVASTVSCIVAQRLVRKVCPDCREDHVLTPDEIRRLGYDPSKVTSLVMSRGKGCGKCRYTGYRGRAAAYELLFPDEMVKDAIINRKSTHQIRQMCIKDTGLVTLLEDGIFKGAEGITSYREILRQLPRLSPPRDLGEIRRLQGELS